MLSEEMRLKSRVSTNAVEKIYISMRHLFNRGFYKPNGVSGENLMDCLLKLSPEIYGSMSDPNKVELNGLTYVIDRLPKGIEQCRYIHFTSDEGFSKTQLKKIIPEKRRRNCYRIDENQMNIEITRGRSDIYDVLTHLTFIFHEADKIRDRAYIHQVKKTTRSWDYVEKIALKKTPVTIQETEIGLIHLASVLGRTFDETLNTYQQLSSNENKNRFFKVIYGLGKLSMNELLLKEKREITFSTLLQDLIGQHKHGDIWASKIKNKLDQNNLLKRPIHIISANMHSVMNVIFGREVLPKIKKNKKGFDFYEELSSEESYMKKITDFALKNGMIYLEDESGTNIDVQIFDLKETIKINNLKNSFYQKENAPVIIVMDYAFGEQAFETMDELLKPYTKEEKIYLNVDSVNIMGKAGILEGGKGDIMVANAHVFEGTADNYPFKNDLTAKDFENNGLNVYTGPMISVLGTSLQNKAILNYFKYSSWKAIGLEMEGVHYQKAIQAASKVRKSVREDIVVRYAYYASDNPLETGSTLASGALGKTGVKPTYLITEVLINKIAQL